MKKHYRKIAFIGMLLIAVLVLSGCVSYDQAGNPSGWVYEYLGKPTTAVLDWIATMFGGSYGAAIIIVTIITRLFMMPSSISMTKSSMMTQAKMKIAQPEIDAIQEDLKTAESNEEQMRLNNELRQVYAKYDIDMMGGMRSGCLPLLVQMPIISAVYAAIRSSEQIQGSSFLGIHMGERSVALVIAVAVVYALQGWLMAKGTPQSDNAQAAQTQKTMMLMNPLMLGWITWTSAAGLGIYFLTGGVFAVIQQLMMNHIIRPRVTMLMEEETKKYAGMKKYQRPRKEAKKVDNSDRLIPTKQTVANSKRNAGKQNRKR